MSYWTDSKVVDDFTPEDRYFYLYLLTNPHTNLSGCYELSLKQASDETGYTKEVIRNLLDRFEAVHDIIRYSYQTKEVLILNWSKFNWTKSKDFQKPLIKEIEAVKEVDFKRFLEDAIEGVKTVPRPSSDGVGTTVTVTDTVSVTDTVTDTVPKKSKKRFKAPTVDEVRNYIEDKNYHVDAEAFVDFYESKGWKVGSNQMKDWKAAVRTWERRWKKEPDKGSGNPYWDMLQKGDY